MTATSTEMVGNFADGALREAVVQLVDATDSYTIVREETRTPGERTLTVMFGRQSKDVRLMVRYRFNPKTEKPSFFVRSELTFPSVYLDMEEARQFSHIVGILSQAGASIEKFFGGKYIDFFDR